MRKIAIFQNDLGVGGIQKSLVNLLKNLDYTQLEVDLYLSVKQEFWTTEFPKELNIKYLNSIPRIFSFIPFDLGKKLVTLDFDGGEYDLAVDFNSYQFSCALGALTVPAKRRVMWVHNNVEIKLCDEWKYRVLWNAFKGKFKYYDQFVCVSKALIEPFRKMSGIVDKKISVIQNYIDVEEIRQKMLEKPSDFVPESDCMNFVALGRLCHQKGYDIMLNIFEKICEERENVRLYIIGDGPDRDTLEARAQLGSLNEKVFFLGNKSNPYCYMNLMDAFVSTSRYEGQPLNIMEAMVVGLPLYCSKNLEKYTDGLRGYEELVPVLLKAEKIPKNPDSLEIYNKTIADSIVALAEL